MKAKENFEMEEINCPICEARERIPFHREGFYQMVRCPSCEFIYLNPRPTDESLLHLYQHYLPEGGLPIQAWRKMMLPVFKRASHLIQRCKGKGRLLDVGAGFGFFLSEMESRGWEVAGIEISQKAIEYARDV
jgi:SAM-dependent methyltransferase